MSENSKNRYLVLAHIDNEKLTYRDVVVPDIVPLYVNTEERKHIGSAHLRKRGKRIYALIEMTDSVLNFGPAPSIALSLKSKKPVIENNVSYIDEGVVLCAYIVNHDAWESLYGNTEDKHVELD